MGRILLTICAITLAIGLAGASPPQKGAGEQPGIGGQGQQSAANPAETPKADSPPSLIASCRQGEAKRDSDLCAQWYAADSAYESSIWTRRTGWLTGFGLIIGTFTMGAAICAALFAKQAADHTKNGASAAWAAEKVTRESAEKQLRAYLGATRLYMTNVEPGHTPKFHYTLKNTGQTPARGIRVRIAILVGARDVRIKFPFGPPPQKFDLGGGSETEQVALWHDGRDVVPPLSQADFEEFVNGKWTFTMAAYVSYKDVFGRSRRTIFRGYAPNHGMTKGKLNMMIAYKHVRAT